MLMNETNREMYGIDSADSIEILKEENHLLGVLDREIQLHKELRHSNIAGLHGVILDSAYGVEFPM